MPTPVESALVARLLGSSGVTNLTAQRVFPTEAPQAPQPASVFPRVIYEVANEYRPKALTGGAGICKATFILDCDGGDGAQGYADAKSLSEQVRQVLHGWRQRPTDGALEVQACFVSDHRDDPDEPRHALERGVQRVSLDAEIWFIESIPITVP